MTHLKVKVAKLFLEWETFQVNVLEKIKTKVLRSLTYFQKSRRLWDNVKIYGRARKGGSIAMSRLYVLYMSCLVFAATPFLHSNAETYTYLAIGPSLLL